MTNNTQLFAEYRERDSRAGTAAVTTGAATSSGDGAAWARHVPRPTAGIIAVAGADAASAAATKRK